MLSGVLAAMTTKWIIFGVMLGVGVIVLGVSILLLLKAKKAGAFNESDEVGFENAEHHHDDEEGEDLTASVAEPRKEQRINN